MKLEADLSRRWCEHEVAAAHVRIHLAHRSARDAPAGSGDAVAHMLGEVIRALRTASRDLAPSKSKDGTHSKLRGPGTCMPMSSACSPSKREGTARLADADALDGASEHDDHRALLLVYHLQEVRHRAALGALLAAVCCAL